MQVYLLNDEQLNQTIPEHWSLEQRKFYYRVKEGDEWLMP